MGKNNVDTKGLSITTVIFSHMVIYISMHYLLIEIHILSSQCVIAEHGMWKLWKLMF